MKKSGQETVVTYAWLFTHGLAMLVNSGAFSSVSDQVILRYLKNAGEAFYDLIVKGRYGKWLLFAAIWGLVLFASMEPKPGTIEGMIYTETTLLEHLIVLLAGAVQVSLFSWLFLKWERGTDNNSIIGGTGEVIEIRTMFFKEKGYFFRFTLLHIIVYILVGGIFYQIAGYEDALATMVE